MSNFRGSFPLGKPAAGFTSILDLKALGDNPQAVDSVLIPCVELFELYILDRMSSNLITGAAAALSLSLATTITAAPGSRFLAISASVLIGAAAGTRLDIEIGVRAPSAASPYCRIASARMGTPYIGGLFTVVAQLTAPLILPVGSTIEMVARGDAAGADHTPSLQLLGMTLA